MKNSKIIIAVLCAVVLIFSFAACAQQKQKTENVTQIVTDENGQAVTGENGEAITEEVQAQIVTDANGKAVTEIVTGENGKPLTTVVNNKYVNVTQNVTVNNKSTQNKTTKKNSSSKTTTTTKKKAQSAPKAPKSISKLSVSDKTKSSVKLSWSKVDCSGYQISISADKGATWSYLEKDYSKTSYTVKDLASDTEYSFRVRAFNKNSAGSTASKWKTAKAKTKENNESRKIKISILLPSDSDSEDVLTVTVEGKEVKKVKVKLDGSTYSFTTEDKFKGKVEISASLKDHGTATIKTDKQECTIEANLSRIPVLIDDED